MDLTTLSGDDTEDRVRRLCAKAMHPVSDSVKAALGIEDLPLHVAAVCVYHLFVETARRALEGSNIRVAAVSTGFPAGLNAFEERLAEIRRSVDAGAHEIDVVITRAHVFGGHWQRLYDEIAAFKEACGAAHCKVILGTGDLGTLRNVARASWVAMMAGADFIKTSTGKESVNATLPVGLVMTRAIREYCERTGMAVGLKPAGGLRTAKQYRWWRGTSITTPAGGHTSPELQYLEAQFAALLSYGVSARILSSVLPLEQVTSVTTWKRHVARVGRRLDEEVHDRLTREPALNEFGLPTRNPLRAVGIDGGYVKASDAESRQEGWFEVMVGKSLPRQGIGQVF